MNLMQRVTRVLVAAGLGAALSSLPACNTTEGFGEDLERAGSELSETSRDVGYQESNDPSSQEYRYEERRTDVDMR